MNDVLIECKYYARKGIRHNVFILMTVINVEDVTNHVGKPGSPLRSKTFERGISYHIHAPLHKGRKVGALQ